VAQQENVKMAKQEINIEELVGKIYFQIATWHGETSEYQEEENKIRLQAASFKIIKTVFSEIGINLHEEEKKNVKGTEQDDKMEGVQSKLSGIAARLKSEGFI